jgi:hypothetical protein
MIMPTTGKRKTTSAQSTLLGTGRLDLKISTAARVSFERSATSAAWGTWLLLTPGNDVENKDDESNDATAGTSLPRLS